jgi:hypothetical protein
LSAEGCIGTSVLVPSSPARSRRVRRAIGAIGGSIGLVFGLSFPAVAQPGAVQGPSHAAEQGASPDVQRLKAWVLQSGDNQGAPFVLIDKVSAQAFVFDRDGMLLGATPVLLGLARGDVAPPDIGDRPLSAIAPEERITPSGRYVAATGPNLTGGSVLWIDYDGALSLHPVRGRPADRRLQRLASPTPEDNRISYGCVNVPVAFYDQVIAPTFRGTTGIVYILPEDTPLDAVFPGV